MSIESKSQDRSTIGFLTANIHIGASRVLWTAIQPTAPQAATGSVLIVDDDPRARRLTQEAVSVGLPGYAVGTAVNGVEGLAAMFNNPPDLVILDLMMPEMDGFEVLERMRADERTRPIPVVILSSRQLSLADVKRLEEYTAVTLRSKDVSTQEEIAASLHQALFDDDALPAHTSALIKQSVAYLHQNYARPLTRQEIADELGMSEDYFSRTFSQELGISPWDYLNRYRVAQAKQQLIHSPDTVQMISHRVGFEAATVDGASHLRRIWHISIPGILPVIVLVTLLRLGHILDAGFNQIFVWYSVPVPVLRRRIPMLQNKTRDVVTYQSFLVFFLVIISLIILIPFWQVIRIQAVVEDANVGWVSRTVPMLRELGH